MANTRHMNGKGTKLTLFLDGKKQEPLDLASWSLAIVGEEIADGVCGEDRDRLDFEVRHYKLSTSAYNTTSKKIVKILVDYVKSLDNRSPEDVSLGITLTDKKNGKTVLSLSEGCIDASELAVGGMIERAMLTIPARFRYMKDV